MPAKILDILFAKRSKVWLHDGEPGTEPDPSKKLPVGTELYNRLMVSTTEDSIIIQKTKELCQAILEQETYRSVREDIDLFLNNDAAQAQYRRVVEQGSQLQQKQEANLPMTGDEITAFETERESLLQNPVAKRFLEAQDALTKVQSSVNEYISKTLELGRVPTSEDLDQGSCGHGCGCSH